MFVYVNLHNYLCRPLRWLIVLWCNGSTTVFGTVCSGSNPAGTTHLDRSPFLETCSSSNPLKAASGWI